MLTPRAATLLAAGICCGLAAAQPADALAPQRVEIEGKPPDDTELRRREPVAKQIYGREELDKYGDTAVSDVLKRLPGVTLSGGNPRLRGLGAGYTLILINGEPAPPGFSLDNLSPSQVERIEVTKGPTAEHSTQAVAGTINIILREAPRQRQRELRMGLGYTALRPVPSFTATYGDRFNGLSLAVPLSGFQWRNAGTVFSERLTRDVSGHPLGLVVRTEERNWGGGFNIAPRLTWKLGESDSLNWQTFAQRNEFNSGGHSATEVQEGLPPISVDDSYRNGGYWQMLRSGLQLVRRWSDGSRLELKGGGQTSRSHFDTQVEGLDGAGHPSLDRLSSGTTTDRSVSSSGKYQRPVGDSHTLAFGWDVEARRREEVRSVTENGQPQLVGFDGEPFDARITREALYLQDEWAMGRQWSTYFGLRGERVGVKSTGLDTTLDSSSTVLSPIWHLQYRLDPKARDLLRASLTRSYRAPDPTQLMARPGIASAYAVNTTNPLLSPDRIGNPALKPELSTGLDAAFEHYFAGGGLFSIAIFERRISGLLRNVVTLENVPWASAPRHVSRPMNLARARSQGIELELKGRAGELLPSWFDRSTALDLRASGSAYRSNVDGIPGPDNRLESQQPWGLTLGFDHAAKAVPLTWGATLVYTPAYSVQQTAAQRNGQGGQRSLDAYGLWAFSRQASLRLGLNNIAPFDNITRSLAIDEEGFAQTGFNRRSARTQLQASLTLKF